MNGAGVMRRRVAVLLGGLSKEREVSLSSGAQCAAALRELGHEVIEIDAGHDLAQRLAEARPDVVFNALHGQFGEDGCAQGVLETLGLPYTHSGVLASALGMDKAKSKSVFAAAGLPLAEGVLASRHEAAARHLLPLPYVVKPNADGSSNGVFIVREGANRPPAQLLDPDWAFGDEVLVEAFIPGRELAVAVMNGRALTVTDIVTDRDFYDYDAKYAHGGSRHVVPADLPRDVFEACLRAAEGAHAALGCRGVTRSDFRYDDATGRLVLLEINTQPGMTPTSLAPEQAAHCGMDFRTLVAAILEDASCRR
jgi:D-alanine-D-alanine ligase